MEKFTQWILEAMYITAAVICYVDHRYRVAILLTCIAILWLVAIIYYGKPPRNT